jgi:hypothetical protein
VERIREAAAVPRRGEADPADRVADARTDPAVEGLHGAVVCAGSLLGGLADGGLASRIPARTLRRVIITLGTALALYYLVR